MLLSSDSSQIRAKRSYSEDSHTFSSVAERQVYCYTTRHALTSHSTLFSFSILSFSVWPIRLYLIGHTSAELIICILENLSRVCYLLYYYCTTIALQYTARQVCSFHPGSQYSCSSACPIHPCWQHEHRHERDKLRLFSLACESNREISFTSVSRVIDPEPLKIRPLLQDAALAALPRHTHTHTIHFARVLN